MQRIAFRLTSSVIRFMNLSESNQVVRYSFLHVVWKIWSSGYAIYVQLLRNLIYTCEWMIITLPSRILRNLLTFQRYSRLKTSFLNKNVTAMNIISDGIAGTACQRTYTIYIKVLFVVTRLVYLKHTKNVCSFYLRIY